MFPWIKEFAKKASDPDTCAAVTPVEHFLIAQAVMSDGQYEHAAFHLAYALSVDPNRAEWLALLNKMIATAPDPRAIVTRKTENFVGSVFVRAYILARLGEFNGHEGALSLIAQVAFADPYTGYLEWLIRWLDAPENAGKLDLRYVDAATSTDDIFVEDEQYKKLFADRAADPFTQRLPRLAAAAAKHQTEAHTFSLRMIRHLRQNGFADEALAAAQMVYERAPDVLSASSLATTYRDRDDWDNALIYFEKAHEFRPERTAILQDLGDVNTMLGRFAEAERWYHVILDIEKDQVWATVSLLFLRYMQAQGEERGVLHEELSAYIAEHKDHERVRGILGDVYLPYFSSYLPERNDSIVGLTQKMLASPESTKDMPPGKGLLIQSSHLEAPSAIQSAQRACAASSLPIMRVEVATIAAPDPRKQTRTAPLSLWQYTEREKFAPAIPEGHLPEVTETLLEIAASPYLFSAWKYKAKQRAKSLGENAFHPLLWAMISPPEKPDSAIPDWDWTFHVQVAAALLIGFIGAGWKDAPHRTYLLSLLRGPMDWSVEAAVIALIAVSEVENDPAVTEEILVEFRHLRRFVPKEGYCCWHRTLLIAMRRLPGISAEEGRALWKEYRELEGM